MTVPPIDSAAVIVAQRRSDYEALADFCQVLAITPHWQRTLEPLTQIVPDLVLISSDDPASVGSLQDLAKLRWTWPAARFIALLNFPRSDEVAALQAAGCDAVLGKPLLLSDLISS